MKIAIDGPSGAGKSTVAKILAKRLNLLYIDTGAMYRAVALYAFNKGIEISPESIIPLLDDIKINVRYSRGRQKILLNNKDVTAQLRKHIISKLASDVAVIPEVRKFLVAIQRELASKNDVVLDGRDIGTYVLPNADFKFYLTASLEERAKRRFLELTKRHEVHELEKIKKDIEERDFNDSNREFAPLKKADDAIEIDSTKYNVEEVVNMMIEIINGGTNE